jgi:hypothetical protein
MLDGELCAAVRAFADLEHRTYANAAKTLILRGLESTSKAAAPVARRVRVKAEPVPTEAAQPEADTAA